MNSLPSQILNVVRHFIKIAVNRINILISIFLIIILNFCKETYQNYQTKNIDTEELLKNIISSKNVQYWQLEYFPNFQNGNLPYKLIFSKGNYDKKLIEKIPIIKNDWNGFFYGCKPAFCAYRITYLENDKWKTVISEEQLKRFIDKIDNEYEAFIIAKINDYDIDINSTKGNGYIKTDNGYKLKLMKYNSCPESKESFTMFIDKKGNLKNVESKGFYMKTKDCIVY